MKNLSAARLGLSLLCFASLAAAQTPLKVLASTGVKAVVEDMKGAAEKAAGRPLAITFDTAAELRKRIAGGEAFDVALLTSGAIDGLLKDGFLNPATRGDLARAGVGVGYRTGAPKPDVHTAESIKKALLAAKSIAYPGDGASTPIIQNLIEKLGLTATLKPRTLLTHGSGPATDAVAAGKADLMMTLVSEILPAPGVSLAGDIPAEFQSYLTFSAAASAKTSNLAAAKAMIAALKSPATVPIYKARGMETVR